MSVGGAVGLGLERLGCRVEEATGRAASDDAWTGEEDAEEGAEPSDSTPGDSALASSSPLSDAVVGRAPLLATPRGLQGVEASDWVPEETLPETGSVRYVFPALYLTPASTITIPLRNKISIQAPSPCVEQTSSLQIGTRYLWTRAFEWPGTGTRPSSSAAGGRSSPSTIPSSATSATSTAPTCKSVLPPWHRFLRERGVGLAEDRWVVGMGPEGVAFGSLSQPGKAYLTSFDHLRGTAAFAAERAEWCHLGTRVLGDQELTAAFFAQLTLQGAAAKRYLKALVSGAHYRTTDDGVDILHFDGINFRQVPPLPPSTVHRRRMSELRSWTVRWCCACRGRGSGGGWSRRGRRRGCGCRSPTSPSPSTRRRASA